MELLLTVPGTVASAWNTMPSRLPSTVKKALFRSEAVVQSKSTDEPRHWAPKATSSMGNGVAGLAEAMVRYRVLPWGTCEFDMPDTVMKPPLYEKEGHRPQHARLHW